MLLAVGGCNSFYDIERTKLLEIDADPCPADTDCDGIIDSVDVCPDVSDAMQQTDLDGDGIGDSCDPCSAGFNPSADEDGDGIAPATDRCPGAYDPGQQDMDADGVGDACDPSASNDRLSCWDDFAVMSRVAAIWMPAGGWSNQASLLVHFPPTSEPMTIASRSSGITRTSFAIQTGVSADIFTDTDLASGLAVGTPTSPMVECVLARTGGQPPEVRLVANGGTVANSPITANDVPVRLTLTIVPGRATCTGQAPSASRVTVSADVDGVPPPPTIFLVARDSHATFDNLVTYELGSP